MLKVANSVINASQIATPITFAGDVTLSTGNLVIGTSGKGIDFSATSSGSGTMTSELLADYEEGTFIPAFSTTGTNFTSITYSKQIGIYTKIGNVVYITLELAASALTAGSPTGDLVVSGYPFTINATYATALPISLAGAYTTNVPSMAQSRTNNTMSRLYYRAASNGALSAMSPTELTSTSTIVLSGFYFV
jgi:hypothetical protein